MDVHIASKITCVQHCIREFDPWPRQTKFLKLVVVAFPLGTQDYGDSTTTGPPVSG